MLQGCSIHAECVFDSIEKLLIFSVFCIWAEMRLRSLGSVSVGQSSVTNGFVDLALVSLICGDLPFRIDSKLDIWLEVTGSGVGPLEDVVHRN